MSAENKRYIDRIRKGEELDDGSKEVPRTAPSFSKLPLLSIFEFLNMSLSISQYLNVNE